ncbi:MAG: hypothetical protein [crAssphage sp. isolate ctcc615]|uniref:Uncharacterized protein n=1 Tax=crAssphage sp. isolate ctcc615 TaxID=2989853 RepID=A0A345BNZ8_9CAUD|nr:MAG: hypothetical protein KNU00_gp45 [crAssphage sp. isolate ctcc615]AXF52169.1 MAG: hypothetical protein [crAssphage sp. isolate ctcc615]
MNIAIRYKFKFNKITIFTICINLLINISISIYYLHKSIYSKKIIRSTNMMTKHYIASRYNKFIFYIKILYKCIISFSTFNKNRNNTYTSIFIVSFSRKNNSRKFFSKNSSNKTIIRSNIYSRCNISYILFCNLINRCWKINIKFSVLTFYIKMYHNINLINNKYNILFIFIIILYNILYYI